MNVSIYNITSKRKDPMATTKISTVALLDDKSTKNQGKMKFSNVFPFSPRKNRET